MGRRRHCPLVPATTASRRAGKPHPAQRPLPCTCRFAGDHAHLRRDVAIHAADPNRLSDPDNRRLCEAAATLAAPTLERLHYIDVAQHTLVAMESERLRHSLLAALSHDLRTPLTALSGNAETLRNALARAQRPEAEQAGLLVEDSRRLARAGDQSAGNGAAASRRGDPAARLAAGGRIGGQRAGGAGAGGFWMRTC